MYKPKISVAEVKAPMSKMKRGKAPGPDEIILEMLLALGEEGTIWLHRVLNAIWRDKRIPDDLLESILVPVLTNKRNIHDCGNYRGIKLLSQMMKCFERILDRRIRDIMELQLGEEQFGFRSGKGTTDAIFIVRQRIERKLEFGQESYWGFLDLEKAYDKVHRAMIPPVLRQYQIPEELIAMVMAMYRTPNTRLVYIILLDYISKQCPMERGQKVVYANYIALGANTREELQQAVVLWYNQLEAHGMKMSKGKTEVMVATQEQAVPQLQIVIVGHQLILGKLDTREWRLGQGSTCKVTRDW